HVLVLDVVVVTGPELKSVVAAHPREVVEDVVIRVEVTIGTESKKPLPGAVVREGAEVDIGNSRYRTGKRKRGVHVRRDLFGEQSGWVAGHRAIRVGITGIV